MTKPEFGSARNDLEMLGQSLKGLLVQMSGGNGLTQRATALRVPRIGPHANLVSDGLLLACAALHDGDVIVVASKIVALAEGRFFRSEDAPPPLTKESLPALRTYLRSHGDYSRDRDLVMLDHIAHTDIWVVSLADPNRSCAHLSQRILRETGVKLDVVISDSGAGVTKGEILIGCTTFVATPLGATMGLSLPQAQRCAASAEPLRNSKLSTPFVLIESDLDVRRRSGIGAERYAGYLDAQREDSSTIPGW